MSIYNKDGSVFKLRGPSPLTKDQKHWSEDKIVLHNFKWGVSKTENSPLKADPEPEIERFIPPPAQKPQIPQVESKFVEKSQNLKNLVIVHFQPAFMVEKKDELYGQAFQRMEYGEKGMLEGVVTATNDFTMTLWSRLDLQKGTVLYPSKYKDGRPFGDRRWWKVNQQRPFEMGHIYECIPSDYQPDFS